MSDRAPKTGTEMSAQARRSLLASQGHGVLSMGDGNHGYGLPISYSYDQDKGRLVFGFVNRPGSKKQQFATATETATLTVYDYEDVDSWESVIVTGTLHSVDDATVPERLTPVFFRREDGGSGMIDLDEFERNWYELRIDDISGRYSGQ
jgi:nitroimidazol reductase NimA-like FMN-containing flavoprotein (pyridoxamine 5'-phosphate oxidase superfamily)